MKRYRVQILVVVAIIQTRWLFLRIVMQFLDMFSFEDRGGEGFPVNGTHTGVSRS